MTLDEDAKSYKEEFTTGVLGSGQVFGKKWMDVQMDGQMDGWVNGWMDW